MQPKDGKAPSPVSPSAPDAAEEADTADPGEIAEIEREPVSPPLASGESESEERTWIEVEMVGEDDRPIPGQRVHIRHPDGRLARGTLNAEGVYRLEGLEPGSYEISFVALDTEAWEPA